MNKIFEGPEFSITDNGDRLVFEWRREEAYSVGFGVLKDNLADPQTLVDAFWNLGEYIKHDHLAEEIVPDREPTEPTYNGPSDYVARAAT